MTRGERPRLNVVFIVIDALCFKSLEREVGGKPVMPFLSSWRAAGRSWDKVFSLAPYTEAALVSLLGGERTLEHGGYLFGNALCDVPLAERYAKNGYRTLLGYSPYVYSEGYLSGFDDFFYTRLYSVVPLFSYRLDHYAAISERRKLKADEIEVCRLLIDEALRCWSSQLQALRDGSRSTLLIRDRVSHETVLATLEAVRDVVESFERDAEGFIEDILREGHGHELWELSEKFNAEVETTYSDHFRDRYSTLLAAYGKSPLRRFLRQPPSVRYLFSTFLNDAADLRNTKGLIRNYEHFYKEDELADYLGELKGNSKVEAGARRQFRFLLEELGRREPMNQPFFAYVQPQDFHLPSVFHTFDAVSEDKIDEEMREAIEMLESVDRRHSGSILADLSARFCDSRIRELYEELQGMSEGCLVVITADHGFPSYYDPPRPMIYNQTYTEAFHVPFLVLGGEIPEDLLNLRDKVVSHPDLVKAFSRYVLNEESQEVPTGFVLSEYVGPGCPDLTEKSVWYTYIDERHRISARCPLAKAFEDADIDTIIDLHKDPEELINIRKKAIHHGEVRRKIRRIAERHLQLSEKHAPETFLGISCAAIASIQNSNDEKGAT